MDARESHSALDSLTGYNVLVFIRWELMECWFDSK